MPQDDSFAVEGGTSFSAPMVSATISLMLSVAPSLTQAQVVSILTNTAKQFPAGSDCTTDRCGAGIVDAGAAVRAAATLNGSATPNYQGLWWNNPPGSESGWGINFAHQGDTIFATWFTYDLDGTPLWLVAIADNTAPKTFAGTLYRTTGPPFNAVPFDATKFVVTPVGSATFTFTDGDNGTFAYTVNGIGGSKAITREVLRAPGTVCQ
jgi:subtilisin family serine protease